MFLALLFSRFLARIEAKGHFLFCQEEHRIVLCATPHPQKRT